MKQRIKDKRAITLVALIITITVLIILAAVAIKIAIDAGIVNLAKNSTEKYAAGQIEESKGMQNTYEMLESATEKIAKTNGESGDLVQIDKAEYEGMKQSISQLESELETIEKEKEYHPGDVVEIPGKALHSSILTSNQTAIMFTINLDKKIGSDVSGAKVTSGNWRVRKAEGGYVIGYGSTNPTDAFPKNDRYDVVINKTAITIYWVNSTAYSITNNSVLSVETYNFVFEFI